MPPKFTNPRREDEYENQLAILNELKQREDALPQPKVDYQLDVARQLAPVILGAALAGKKGFYSGAKGSVKDTERVDELREKERAAYDRSMAELSRGRADAQKSAQQIVSQDISSDELIQREDLRSQNKLEAANIAATRKPLNAKEALPFATQLSAVDTIQNTILPKLAEIKEEDFPDFIKNKALSFNANTPQGDVAIDMEGLSRIMARANEKGVLTQEDVNAWTRIVTGGWTAGKVTAQERLGQIMNKLQTDSALQRKILELSGYDPQVLDSIGEEFKNTRNFRAGLEKEGYIQVPGVGEVPAGLSDEEFLKRFDGESDIVTEEGQGDVGSQVPTDPAYQGRPSGPQPSLLTEAPPKYGPGNVDYTKNAPFDVTPQQRDAINTNIVAIDKLLKQITSGGNQEEMESTIADLRAKGVPVDIIIESYYDAGDRALGGVMSAIQANQANSLAKLGGR